MALWRDQVEADFESWIAPYLAARDGADMRLAVEACEKVLDRLYGRSAQPLAIIDLDSELPGDSLAVE
jgi:hypothetical protein